MLENLDSSIKENFSQKLKTPFYIAAVFGVTLTELTSQISSPTPKHSASQPSKVDDQLASEELIATQKRLIMLQHQRIENLENENQQLRQQIQYIEKC